MKICSRCRRKNTGQKRICPRCLAWFAAKRAEHVAGGLCGIVSCKSPSLAGLAVCEKHRELTRVYNARQRSRKVAARPLSKSLNDYDAVL